MTFVEVKPPQEIGDYIGQTFVSKLGHPMS